MNNIKEKVEKLNSMILEGQILEAFDQYYADEVVMQDNDTALFERKQAFPVDSQKAAGAAF